MRGDNFLRTLEGKNRIWSVAEHSPRIGFRQSKSFTCLRLCSYLPKYTLSPYLLLLIQKYPFMNFSKCYSPFLFFPLGFSSSWEYSWWEGEGAVAAGSDTVLTSMVDTDRAAKILQPSRIPEEWTPPSVSVAPLLLLLSSPLAAFLPSFSSKAGGETRRRAQQYRLAATHIANLKPSKE